MIHSINGKTRVAYKILVGKPEPTCSVKSDDFLTGPISANC
jgi:hypothetical protein